MMKLLKGAHTNTLANRSSTQYAGWTSEAARRGKVAT